MIRVSTPLNKSLFSATHLQFALFVQRHLFVGAGTHVTPAVNQVEFHPLIYSVQRPLLEFCREHGIVLQAYAPLGSVDGVPTPLNASRCHITCRTVIR